MVTMCQMSMQRIPELYRLARAITWLKYCDTRVNVVYFLLSPKLSIILKGAKAGIFKLDANSAVVAKAERKNSELFKGKITMFRPTLTRTGSSKSAFCSGNPFSDGQRVPLLVKIGHQQIVSLVLYHWLVHQKKK
uniref:Uncharacterized protein n=1 Tax=Romanomermis culicivorax TaxID=13658 RepID=A0A915JHL0_ROMCU